LELSPRIKIHISNESIFQQALSRDHIYRNYFAAFSYLQPTNAKIATHRTA
jgi:hypothetical protein